MNNNQALGYFRVIDAIKGGEDVASVLVDMANARTLSQNSADIFGGALSCVIDSFQGLKDAGLPVTLPSVKDRSLNRFLALGRRAMTVEFMRLLDQPHDVNRATELGNRLFCVSQVTGIYRKSLGWRYPSATKAEKPAPQEIRIVGMPDRTSQTVVKRDENDEIVKTVQVESDMQWAKAD